MKATTTDLLVMGGGVAGLAAARAWGAGARVLERGDRPGGLVRSHRVGDWWFDHVLHLLYFPDEETRRWVGDLAGVHLVPCAPEARVHTAAGVARYPVQLHLADLGPDAASACLRDLLAARFDAAASGEDFSAWLQATFGAALCDLFMFPYNRKMWKRPLASLAPGGFNWTITRPDPKSVVAGALRPVRHGSYNTSGFYPCPPDGADVRGMEVLSRALASGLAVETGCEVVSIAPARQRVTVREADGMERQVEWKRGCISTLPLPRTVALCADAPDTLRDACAALTCNRVVSVAFGLAAPPARDGVHWRYFADEALAFNRLVFMDAFDPGCSRDGTSAVLAEITQRAEAPLPDMETLAGEAEADLWRCGAFAKPVQVLARAAWIADPAYVVFTRENQAVMREARTFLQRHGIEPLGRYGRWEYSSMAQVIRDGRALASKLKTGVAP